MERSGRVGSNSIPSTLSLNYWTWIDDETHVLIRGAQAEQAGAVPGKMYNGTIIPVQNTVDIIPDIATRRVRKREETDIFSCTTMKEGA